MSAAKIIDAADAADARFLDAVRTRLNARSLVQPPAAVEIEHAQFARMLALADEGLARRQQRREEPPQQGPIGHVANSGIDRESGAWFVRVHFDDEETARRAATLLFRDVQLNVSPATPAGDAG